MARPGVTESEVFEAIQSLLEIGAKITVESVRAELGHGSPNTINRHLRTWRTKPQQIVVRESSLQVKHLKKQLSELEVQLQTSFAQTEQLSLELLGRDQKIFSLEKELEENRQSLKDTHQKIEHLNSLQEAIIQERQQIVDALVNAQKVQVEQFREDIKAINQMSLSQIREMSISSQDVWLEEKIKVRDLIKEMEQLRSTQENLRQQILSEQQVNQPLRKRIKEQEQIIKHCLDPKKFETYRSGSENDL